MYNKHGAKEVRPSFCSRNIARVILTSFTFVFHVLYTIRRASESVFLTSPFPTAAYDSRGGKQRSHTYTQTQLWRRAASPNTDERSGFETVLCAQAPVTERASIHNDFRAFLRARSPQDAPHWTTRDDSNARNWLTIKVVVAKSR